MSVIIYIEGNEGKVKKSSIEAAAYGAAWAKHSGGQAIGVALGTFNAGELESLGNVGVNKILHDSNASFAHFDSSAVTKALANAASQQGASNAVVSYNQNGKAVAPRLAIRLDAGFVPGATSLPDSSGKFSKNVFSGKAIAHYQIQTANKVVGLSPNSYKAEKTNDSASVESWSSGVSDADFKTKVTGEEKVSGTVPLTEAEIVVSAGRGLKGPENWGMIEELAKEMGAATACSRPVADSHWRPHHEHVGQTGVTVRPNLYFAIGISGAIQHLAGVNGSKKIVVINNDPEAPFFKAADYGIVGDAFDVVPKLIEEYKKFKASNH